MIPTHTLVSPGPVFTRYDFSVPYVTGSHPPPSKAMRLVTSPLLTATSRAGQERGPSYIPDQVLSTDVGWACPREGAAEPELTSQAWDEAEGLVVGDGEASGPSRGHVRSPCGPRGGELSRGGGMGWSCFPHTGSGLAKPCRGRRSRPRRQGVLRHECHRSAWS